MTGFVIKGLLWRAVGEARRAAGDMLGEADRPLDGSGNVTGPLYRADLGERRIWGNRLDSLQRQPTHLLGRPRLSPLYQADSSVGQVDAG